MTIHHERRGPVGIITIDRPQVRNALDIESLLGITAALRDDASPGSGIRVVVLTGAGDRAFSAGMDLAAMAKDGMPDPTTSPLTLLREDYPLPVIAAVNGAAIGGGFELALACDLRIAADHAVFALPEVSLGFAPSEGGVELAHRIPLAMALEIALTADHVSAARAYEMGLVNRVVPGTMVVATAVALAERISQHSPVAVRLTKELTYRTLWSDREELHSLAAQRSEELLAGPDAVEGPAAFLAKRPPRWRSL